MDCRQCVCRLLLFFLFASLTVSSAHCWHRPPSNNRYLKIYYYKGRYRISGEPIPQETVTKLLELCKRPIINSWHLPKEKVPWLKLNSKLALDEYVKRNKIKLYPGQTDVFIRAFESYGDRTHTSIRYAEDDFYKNPVGYLFVDLITKDNQPVRFSSTNNYPLLAPWIIKTRKREIRTYNNDLTKMLVSLFQESNFDSKDESKAFREAIADSIIKIENYDEWNKLEADHRFPKELSVLSKHFSVSKPRVDNSVAAIFNPFGKYLFATLQDKRMPPNFEIGVALKIQEGKPRGLGKFIARTKNTIDFMKSVPHLLSFIKGKQNYTFKLRYADESYLSSQSQTELEEDLKSNKGGVSRRQLWTAMKGIELTVTNNDNWNDRARLLLFQDKRTFLWSATKGCQVFKLDQSVFGEKTYGGQYRVLKMVTLGSDKPKFTSWFGLKGDQ